MIDVHGEIQINRPVGEVFEFLADQTNAPRWQDGLIEVRRETEGAIRVGTRHTAVRRFLGRRLELSNEYVRFEPQRQITFTGASGPMTFEMTYATEPAAMDGTKVTGHMTMNQRGLLGLADPLVSRAMRRDFADNFRQLRVVLEETDAQAQTAARRETR